MQIINKFRVAEFRYLHGIYSLYICFLPNQMLICWFSCRLDHVPDRPCQLGKKSLLGGRTGSDRSGRPDQLVGHHAGEGPGGAEGGGRGPGQQHRDGAHRACASLGGQLVGQGAGEACNTSWV